ncbi:MAG: hypothetical protein BWK79_00755 [Beggiatoa sp. IS2]|nr:MAG: hypothetical protein BWK79_00755 [Beggiatoa sp. IS2]
MFRHLLNKLIPQSCFLCRTNGPQFICADCLADLPYQQQGCHRCARPLVTDDYLCTTCQAHPPVFEHAQTVFTYRYPIDKLIHAAKYSGNFGVLFLLGEIMATHLHIDNRPEVLIPVPLHPRRLRQRGYNQSLELAKIVARHTGIPIDYKACVRQRYTVPQVSLQRLQREENIRGAFRVQSASLKWTHVAILDDVMTTGSTVQELARVLTAAGVKRVEVWCCARTLD